MLAKSSATIYFHSFAYRISHKNVFMWHSKSQFLFARIVSELWQSFFFFINNAIFKHSSINELFRLVFQKCQSFFDDVFGIYRNGSVFQRYEFFMLNIFLFTNESNSISLIEFKQRPRCFFFIHSFDI